VFRFVLFFLAFLQVSCYLTAAPSDDPCGRWTWIDYESCDMDLCYHQGTDDAEAYSECREGACWCCDDSVCWPVHRE
jgi:hypothetical protein